MWLSSPTFCLSQVIASACFSPKEHLNCSFGWAKELSNLIMKKKIENQIKRRCQQRDPFSLQSGLVASSCFELTWLPAGNQSCFFVGSGRPFSISGLQVKWAWSLGFFTVFYFSCPCSSQPPQGKWGSHSPYTPCLAQPPTLTWLWWGMIDTQLIDWLIDV